jgi:CRISPR/Cas system-associated endonuclease Cas1
MSTKNSILRLSFKNEGEIISLEKQKLKEVIAIRPAMQKQSYKKLNRNDNRWKLKCIRRNEQC